MFCGKVSRSHPAKGYHPVGPAPDPEFVCMLMRRGDVTGLPDTVLQIVYEYADFVGGDMIQARFRECRADALTAKRLSDEWSEALRSLKNLPDIQRNAHLVSALNSLRLPDCNKWVDEPLRKWPPLVRKIAFLNLTSWSILFRTA